MNLTSLNAETLRQYLPNYLAEVEGEDSLFAKLEPFIFSSKEWLENKVLSSLDILTGEHERLAIKVVAAHAFATAAPSLDLILTPTGFGVVSSNAIAPASKERVERLIASLKDYVEAQLTVLVRICKADERWRQTKQGKYFCSTFLGDYTRVEYLPGETTSYEYAREIYLLLEARIAEGFTGRRLMDTLREGYHSGTIPSAHPLIERLRSVLLCLLAHSYAEKLSDYLLWSLALPFLSEIRYYPEYKKIQDEDMPPTMVSADFINHKQGSYYF